MNQLVSYAQNFEDVILYRALKAVSGGCYIDVGAQSPEVDSVSRLFHGLGWRGVHVEPVLTYANQLEEARPDDLIIRAALGDERGSLVFYEIPSTGLSTTDQAIANRHKAEGFEVIETQTQVLLLDDVFAQSGFQDIHWLKIDVEGFEEHVIRGWRGETRPWVVVVESTLPLSQVQSHHQWEPLLLAKGYRFAYFDGLNRFYVAEPHEELLSAFGPGPNVFDDFSLSGEASQPFVSLLNHQIEALRKEQCAQTLAQAAEVREHEEAAQALRQAMEREVREHEENAQALRHEMERIEAEFAVFRRGSASIAMQLEITQRKLRDSQAQADAMRDAFAALNAHVTLLSADRAERARIAHYWWVTAEQARTELDGIKASRSWRFTAPIRSLRGGHYSTRAFVKQIVRAVLARVMRRVIGRRYLVRPIQVMLSVAPGIKGRLRNIAVAYGFIAANAAGQVVVLGPAAATSHPALSLKASRVLDDLNAALRTESK
ncbi:FkbM family methyltransferase [Dyella halodurans]|uniref:FkbM family methyltransferase n=1 Tax=Dyella halodurans TaxID=1920171 RepID=A0ABV9BXF8_9GAMM|nr:FkbM family methyltransferase [Dyella halodurans]